MMRHTRGEGMEEIRGLTKEQVESGKVAVRTRRGKDLGSMDVNEVIEKLQQEIRSRSLKQLEE